MIHQIICGACRWRRRLLNWGDGTLAAARLDFDFHLRNGLRAVSDLVLAGLRVGKGLVFLMAFFLCWDR